MKRKLCLFTFFLFCLSVTWVSAKQKSPTLPDSYVIVAGKTLEKDTEWRPVIDALSQKHDNAPVIYYHNSPYETLYRLKQLRPRYVAVVEKPENLNRDYVISFHKLSRTIDDDIFADFLAAVLDHADHKHANRFGIAGFQIGLEDIQRFAHGIGCGSKVGDKVLLGVIFV